MTVLTDLMLSRMARNNQKVLKFIHKITAKHIKEYLKEINSFREKLRTQVGINKKEIDSWSGF